MTETERVPLVNLGAVAKRADAASPGPWEPIPHDHIRKGCKCLSCVAVTGWEVRGPDQAGCGDSAQHPEYGMAISEGIGAEWPPANTCDEYVMTYEDTEFIAAARADVPALVDENLRMRDLLSYLALHIGRYEWKQLTTDQKELLADVIEEKHQRMEAEDGLDYTSVPVNRWWRDD